MARRLDHRDWQNERRFQVMGRTGLKASRPRSSARAFCRRFGLELPILMAPMAGSCPPRWLRRLPCGRHGRLWCTADAGRGDGFAWAEPFRGASNGAFQMNLWIPDPAPVRARNGNDRASVPGRLGIGARADAAHRRCPISEPSAGQC